MAKFLSHQNLQDEFNEMMHRARELVVLISPVLKLNRKLERLLEHENKSDADVYLIYAINKTDNSGTRFLNHLDSTILKQHLSLTYHLWLHL